MTNGQQVPAGANLLMAFLLGAVAGAAVALLYAPASGADTRRALGQRTREGRDRMMEALRQGRGILDEQRENVVTAFERARQQAQGPREGDQEA
jgi:gas vesicle protein